MDIKQEQDECETCIDGIDTHRNRRNDNKSNVGIDNKCTVNANFDENTTRNESNKNNNKNNKNGRVYTNVGQFHLTKQAVARQNRLQRLREQRERNQDYENMLTINSGEEATSNELDTHPVQRLKNQQKNTSIHHSEVKEKCPIDITPSSPSTSKTPHNNTETVASDHRCNKRERENNFQSEEEKKKKRLVRNRQAAQASRERKKQYIQQLENKVKELVQRVQDLEGQRDYYRRLLIENKIQFSEEKETQLNQQTQSSNFTNSSLQEKQVQKSCNHHVDYHDKINNGVSCDNENHVCFQEDQEE